MQGEVAKLRQQIDDELNAMEQGFKEFSITGRHDIIARKYNYLGVLADKLAENIGEEADHEYAYNNYIKIVR